MHYYSTTLISLGFPDNRCLLAHFILDIRRLFIYLLRKTLQGQPKSNFFSASVALPMALYKHVHDYDSYWLLSISVDNC